jgi:hypothetical protein
LGVLFVIVVVVPSLLTVYAAVSVAVLYTPSLLYVAVSVWPAPAAVGVNEQLPVLGLPAVRTPVQVAELPEIVTVTLPVGFGCPLWPVTLKFTVTAWPVTEELSDSDVI